MQTVAETTIFRRRAEALLSEQEHLDLIEFLASNVYLGDEIVEIGGVRKLGFAARGKTRAAASA